jgi:CRP-like cAMP-binding protein
MNIEQLLSGIELFEGLDADELSELAGLFKERRLSKGDVLAQQGTPGDEMYLVTEGFVEVLVENGQERPVEVIVNLGVGQIIGEMSLVDQGLRSATVRAISSPTVVMAIHRQDFERLCQKNTRLGYVVMRNIAADLSFKLRHRHLDG